MTALPMDRTAGIVGDLVTAIQQAKAYLSRIDGAIGDGDHGINMNKGFTIAGERIAASPGTLDQDLTLLSQVLMNEIGGSMGPLYGMFFRSMARQLKDVQQIDTQTFGAMLQGAIKGVQKVSEASVGDKTMIDCLVPAEQAFRQILETNGSFVDALAAMKTAAREGRDATRDMVARVGRSARLGERSRGVIDAGAASCEIILNTLADSLVRRMGLTAS